jgi:hypothetical protein
LLASEHSRRRVTCLLAVSVAGWCGGAKSHLGKPEKHVTKTHVNKRQKKPDKPKPTKGIHARLMCAKREKQDVFLKSNLQSNKEEVVLRT